MQERTKRKEDAKRIQKDRYEMEASIFRDNEECERLIKMNMINGKEAGYIPLLQNATVNNFGSKETKGVTPSKKMLDYICTSSVGMQAPEEWQRGVLQ